VNSGYQVMIDNISGTGQAAARVADGLRAATCSSTVPTGDLGMPGSRAAQLMAQVRHALVQREAGFEARLDTHASNMAKAADHYAAQESSAAADLTIHAHGPVKAH
jgi:hypothetical protein